MNESDDTPCASADPRAQRTGRGHRAKARNDRPPLLHILLGHVSLQNSVKRVYRPLKLSGLLELEFVYLANSMLSTLLSPS